MGGGILLISKFIQNKSSIPILFERPVYRMFALNGTVVHIKTQYHTYFDLEEFYKIIQI